MVSRTLINAAEIVAYCFTMVPILFLGFSDEIALATGIAFAIVIVRLVVQVFIRNKLPDTQYGVVPVLKMYTQPFNVMWFAMFGSVALILADGELFATMWRVAVVAAAWIAFYVLMRFIDRRNAPEENENM